MVVWNIFIIFVSIIKDMENIHSTCCVIHGCHFGYNNCPVVNGEIRQKQLCKLCIDCVFFDVANHVFDMKFEYHRITDEYNKKLDNLFLIKNRKYKIKKLDDSVRGI